MSTITVRTTSPFRGVEGTILLEAVDAEGTLLCGPKATLVGLIHGNEIVGESVLHRIQHDAAHALRCGSLLLVRANLEAQKLNRRHTPGGQDLNRQWGFGRQSFLRQQPPDTLCYEQQRSLELAPLLADRDAILDLHSTSRPAPPFLVFRDDAQHLDIASALGIEYLVTGLHEGAILDGGACPDVYLRPGEASSRIGFTFESGQHLDPTNIARAYEVACRLLHRLGVWSECSLPSEEIEPKVYEVIERVRQAPAGVEPYRFVGYLGGEAGSKRLGAPRPLASFDEIEADEVVLKRGRSRVVRAHGPFTMLLPTPNADPNTDLYYVAQLRPASRAVRRDHAEARQEALGVERMLEWLDADAYGAGATRASFDARLALDLCAEAVAHTMNLPPGHPHRRITVVGRGDWGGDEAERRAGKRYRTAMKRAFGAGVPIDRVQLLRGATLGWLSTLTASSMAGHMQRRRSQEGMDAGMRLFLSARQPHTLSVIVVGDIGKALRDGDVEHVRVGILIEAATVEAEGAEARVRVSRAGLFSARPEFLAPTARMLDALREEHRFLMRRPEITENPLFAKLIDEDGAIRPQGDAVALAALRQVLCRFQLSQWQDSFGSDLTPQTLRSPEERGRWLAQTMAATGILDADGLSALLLVPEGDGVWRVDPRSIPRLLASEVLDIDALVPNSAPPLIPDQPILAADVDADSIERYCGWKRFLRMAQMIPDTRGKDLDLAFDEHTLTTRTGAWWQRARALAAEKPGQVMVVVAGDGLNPARESSASSLLSGHRAALIDPNLRYLRIQHAQGTHLSWLKDMIQLLSERPEGEPVAMQWEAAHGSSVNVMLIAVRELDTPERPWSLEGWQVERCMVLISELKGSGVRDYRVGLFTEPIGPERRVNQELLHFGRAHCEGLLAQGGPRVLGQGASEMRNALEEVAVQQIAGWVERVRAWHDVGGASVDQRAHWVAGQLGLSDQRLARALAEVSRTRDVPTEAARRIWGSVPAWRPLGEPSPANL